MKKERKYQALDLTFFLGAHLQSKHKHSKIMPLYNPSESAFEIDDDTGTYICKFLSEEESLYASIEARLTFEGKDANKNILDALRKKLIAYSFFDTLNLYNLGGRSMRVSIRVNKIPIGEEGYVSGSLFSAVGDIIDSMREALREKPES